jgi:hypothetical protein
MESTPAWKLELLNEALPKFTAAIESCANTEDTTEMKDPARNLITVIQTLIFKGEA